MTTSKEILAALSAPFTEGDISWRAQNFYNGNNGLMVMVIPYIQSRAVMNRLDDVLGIENWKDSYKEVVVNNQVGFLCTLAIRINDEWIEKTDGADGTDIEMFKGGLSGALKRAAIKFGIGRYLYDVEGQWADVQEKRSSTATLRVAGKVNGQKVSGWIVPPVIKTVNTSPTPPQQTSQQQRNTQGAPRTNDTSHSTLVSEVRKLLVDNGIGANFEPFFLERVNANVPKFEAATTKQLQSIKQAILPVANFLHECRIYSLPIESVFYYAQVVTGMQINHVMDLYFVMTNEMALNAISMVQAEVQGAGQIQA